MDISKATNANKLNLCQTYFRVGLACLPFVWAINVVWFFDEAFRVPSYPEQEKIRKYVIMSLIGAFLWTAIIISWVVIFQTNRAEWGEFADHISFVIPAGRA
ncbi:gamma-secretase subunit pen-2 [Eurosta solidaginis]|uniref:gamma-secretase subunit pen-2 n=1 Tax=Eurosta solidaginis TaxID=178769 RepID=UPI003530E4F2